MKRIWIICLTVLLLLTVTLLPAFAEESEAVTEPVTETEPESLPKEPTLWQEMLTYLEQNGVSADSFGEDTVDKVIALGEQFTALKEQGYTLEERLTQLVTPENILTTASALVLVVSTLVLFIMKRRQRAATLAAAKSMETLKEAYDTEAEENAALRRQVEELRAEQTAMAELLGRVSEGCALNAEALKTSRDCAVGVANMVKDVFLNARTLDHAGKELMLRNYLRATASAGTEENTEEGT